MDENTPQVMQSELFVADAFYESSNELEIPDLKIEMQAKVCDRPFVLWGEQRRTFQMNGQGVLHFYTDDYRFGKDLYEHPEKILKHNPASIVEPNYSLFNDTPIAFGLQAIYKKRFIARAMQDRGIRTFVDLNVGARFYKLNLLGVPMGWSAFCTRGYSDRLQYLEFEYEMARMMADGNDLLFVVYGGGENVRAFCRQHGCIFVTPTIAIKNKVKAFEKIKESVSFFGEPIEVTKSLPTFSDLMENQVEDFKKKLT